MNLHVLPRAVPLRVRRSVATFHLSGALPQTPTCPSGWTSIECLANYFACRCSHPNIQTSPQEPFLFAQHIKAPAPLPFRRGVGRLTLGTFHSTDRESAPLSAFRRQATEPNQTMASRVSSRSPRYATARLFRQTLYRIRHTIKHTDWANSNEPPPLMPSVWCEYLL